MAITRVQGNKRAVNSGSTISATLDSAPINGNLLVAAIGSFHTSASVPTVSSISQTGVTWAEQELCAANGASTTYNRCFIWVGVVGAGASADLTVNLSGAPATRAMVDVCEYSGLATTDFLDVKANATGANTAPLTGTTASTTVANELWVGGLAVMNWTSALTTPLNSFTLLDGAVEAGFCSVGYLEKIVSATATANSGATSPDSTYWGGCIITLKEATVEYYPYIQQISNIDATADVGAHSAFANQQAVADSTYDTLTEADTDAGTSTFGQNAGTATTYRTTVANEIRLGSFAAASTGEVASIVFYGRGVAATNGKAIITDSSGNLLTNGVGAATAISATAGTKTMPFTAGSRPLVVSGTTYWIGVIGQAALRVYYASTTGATSKQDTTNSYATPTNPTDAGSTTETWRQMYANINNLNYQLQLEEQFANVPYATASGFTLHVYTGSYSSPAETLNIQVWNAAGSAWVTLGALTASTDNSFDVSTYAASANLYIRFLDGTTSNDAVQSTWQIDSVWLAATYPKAFTANAELAAGAATYTKTFTADSNLTGTLTKAFTANGTLQKNLTKTFTAAANLLQNLTKAFTSNANLLKNLPKTLTANGNLTGNIAKAFTSNANLLKSQIAALTSNANLLQNIPKTVTADANLTGSLPKTFTGNAHLTQNLTKTFNANANLTAKYPKTFTGNAELESSTATYTLTFTVGATLMSPSAIISPSSFYGAFEPKLRLSRRTLRLIKQYLELKQN